MDYLVQKRLAEAGLKPSPEADRRTLIRRLYLDLVGLPPKPEEVDAFAADPDPQAYPRLVEQLLASPHYGERMAIGWLDVVRFADTIGYHSDNPRNVWPYRDYVIRAFNENKPFDEFTVEQLAGDLLPGSTQEQKVGSCFNRLLLSTEEGGAQAKDYEARMLTDRVRAVGTVWLGQTFGCCQCHDHKFDPIKTRDFYSMGAFSPISRSRSWAAARPAWRCPTRSRPPNLPAWTPRSPRASSSLPRPARVEPRTSRSAEDRPERRSASGWSWPRRRRPRWKPACRGAWCRSRRASRGVVRILPRGNWMNESGPVVEPALPAFLPGPKIEGRRLTRLDLARWIGSRGNPLTARVLVNRLWKQFFGDRHMPDAGRPGLARRVARQSSTAGLAGLRVHG